MLVSGTVLAALVAGGWTRDHIELERSEPAQDTVVATPPSRIVLDYTTDVHLAVSTVVVRRAQGQPEPGARTPVAGGEVAHLADDRRDVLVLPLAQPLPDGAYQVAWTTGGPDGHAVSGAFGFRVAQEVADTPSTTVDTLNGGGTLGEASEPSGEAGDTLGTGDTLVAGDTSGTGDTLDAGDTLDTGGASAATASSAVGSALAPAATRFVFYLGVVGLLGAVAFRLLVAGALARQGSREVYQAAVGRAWKIAALSTGAVLASAPFRLWFQVQAFFPGDPTPDLRGILTDTPWGAGWMLHAGLGVLAGAAVALARKQGPRGAGWGVAGISALCLPLVPVLSGHAWSAEPRSLAAPALYLHATAASIWIGGLFCVLFAGVPAVKRHAEDAEEGGLAPMVAAFSRIAVVAVVFLAASGGANAWIRLEALPQLWTTAWGRALLVKLAVVAGVMAMGFYNWRMVRPALAESPRPGLLTLPAFVELALAAAALAATSWLVAQPLA